MSVTTAPVADWVTLEDLYADPFPIFERLRHTAPVAFVPAAGRYLVTSYDAVHQADVDQATFSAREDASTRTSNADIEPSMLNKDDPEHLEERRVWQPALRPAPIKRTWAPVFRENADRFIDELVEAGPGTDLLSAFSAPFVSENLRRVLGIENATHQDMNRWSTNMIAGRSNVARDPRIAAEAAAASVEIDAAVDDMIDWYLTHGGDTLLAHLVSLGSAAMPLASIRSNMKMTIGGGINEPRDAIGTATWALLDRPAQRRLVENDPSLWGAVFEEAVRWISPIGMIRRRTTRDVELGGVALPAGASLGLCLSSANRDESRWSRPEEFDIERGSAAHLAFGKGTHVCAGNWVAKSQVADVALPALFGRLRGLAIDPSRPVRSGGWVFRGLLDLPVTWDSVSAREL